jgi:DinB superfamily
MLSRPNADEYFEYFGRYILLVPDGNLRDILRTQLAETVALLSGVTDEKAEKAYGAGKWTLKEAVLHMSDAERVFGYRMLRISRGDATPLPGFEQDEWVPHSCANDRALTNLVIEFVAIRGSTLALVDSISPEGWMRTGTAGGHKISARALAYIAAGHERHHMRIFRERYLRNE